MSRHTRPRHISFLYIIVSFMLSPPSVSAQMMSDDRNHPKEFTALQYGAGYGRMEQKGKQRGDGPVTELKEKLELLDRKKVMIAVCTVLLTAGLTAALVLFFRGEPEVQEEPLPIEEPEPQDWLVNREQVERLAYDDSVLGYVSWELSDEALADLNRVLTEYGITTAEDISQFLAQAAIESLAGTALTEWGDEEYFRGRGYSEGTRGAGYLHLTFAYGQMAFAVWLMKKYVPALSEIDYASPAEHGRDEISRTYYAALQTAANLGLNVSAYSRVVYNENQTGGLTTGADYIAEKFAWESAAYFWYISGVSQSFLKFPCSMNTDIASKIVGGSNWQSRREAYAAFYPVLAEAFEEEAA